MYVQQKNIYDNNKFCFGKFFRHRISRQDLLGNITCMASSSKSFMMKKTNIHIFFGINKISKLYKRS